MTNKNDKVNFDNFAEEYDQLLRESVGFFSKSDRYFAEYKVAIARELVREDPHKILEFGCGTGRNVPFLQAKFPGAVIHGTDISKKSLAEAKHLSPDAHFFIDDEDFYNDPGKYDFVFVAGVFHHVAPDLRDPVLDRIKSKMAPGGSILVFEHNPYNPITRRIVSNCKYDADAVLLAMKETSTRLTSCGFMVLEKGYCLFFPERLGAMSKLDRYLRLLPLGGQYFVYARYE